MRRRNIEKPFVQNNSIIEIFISGAIVALLSLPAAFIFIAVGKLLLPV